MHHVQYIMRVQLKLNNGPILAKLRMLFPRKSKVRSITWVQHPEIGRKKTLEVRRWSKRTIRQIHPGLFAILYGWRIYWTHSRLSNLFTKYPSTKLTEDPQCKQMLRLPGILAHVASDGSASIIPHRGISQRQGRRILAEVGQGTDCQKTMISWQFPKTHQKYVANDINVDVGWAWESFSLGTALVRVLLAYCTYYTDGRIPLEEVRRKPSTKQSYKKTRQNKRSISSTTSPHLFWWHILRSISPKSL